MKGEPVNLLDAAASHAFWRLDNTFLHKLAKRFKIHVPDGSSLFGTILKMTMSILKLSEEAAMEIVTLRPASSTRDGKSTSDLLQCDEAMEVLDVFDLAKIFARGLETEGEAGVAH